LQVVLLFPRQFWPKDADMFGRIAETTAERGDFFLFYSYADLAGQLAALGQPPPSATYWHILSSLNNCTKADSVA
jgi:hypothetical protein